jgi:hypothetical protein
MRLADIAKSKKSVSIKALGSDTTLAKEVQKRLIVLGCLDPKADGQFGTISQLALSSFARREALPFDDRLTGPIAQALLEETPKTFIPLKLGSDLGSRLVRYMQAKKYHVARLPGHLNIVYLEGSDVTGRHNADRADEWNDRRIVFVVGKNGRPTITHNVPATTEPGLFFTDHPLNKGGAARIAFQQYKAWMVGTHKAGTKTAQEALVQAGSISVFRDKNKDGIRPGDTVHVGSGFGINQHGTLGDKGPKTIGRWSAGCLVARQQADHRLFMKIVKRDPRFGANNGYRFMTAVIAGDDLDARVP